MIGRPLPGAPLLSPSPMNTTILVLAALDGVSSALNLGRPADLLLWAVEALAQRVRARRHLYGVPDGAAARRSDTLVARPALFPAPHSRWGSDPGRDGGPGGRHRHRHRRKP